MSTKGERIQIAPPQDLAAWMSSLEGLAGDGCYVCGLSVAGQRTRIVAILHNDYLWDPREDKMPYEERVFIHETCIPAEVMELVAIQEAAYNESERQPSPSLGTV